MALNLINSTTPTGAISAADVAADMTAIETWATAREAEITALEAKTSGYALTFTTYSQAAIAYAVVPASGTIRYAAVFIVDVGTATGNIDLEDGGSNGAGTTVIRSFNTTTTAGGNERLAASGLSHSVSAGDVLRLDPTGLDATALTGSENGATVTVWIETALL